MGSIVALERDHLAAAASDDDVADAAFGVGHQFHARFFEKMGWSR
jgi:hypothetical protein